MDIIKTGIPDLSVFCPRIFTDGRGFFMESYNRDRYRDAGVDADFVQDNMSLSKRNVVRGLHYQAPPFEQGKLVSVVAGRVLDVAVDIRFGSPTFGKFVMVELSAANHRQFWIPAGFAHGFIALEDDTVFVYKCTNVYSPEHDRGIIWNDPDIAIEWPVITPIVSEKDARLPRLKDITKEFFVS